MENERTRFKTWAGTTISKVPRTQSIYRTGRGSRHISYVPQWILSLSLFFFFFLFRATPVAYGHPQARGWIRVAAAGLHHSHSNAGIWAMSVTYTTALAMPDPQATQWILDSSITGDLSDLRLPPHHCVSSQVSKSQREASLLPVN